MKGLKHKKTGKYLKNIKISKECPICLLAFSPRLEKQKFCSRKCMGKYYTKDRLRNCIVCNKDNWKCKINNKDCIGRLEVHHILGFTEYPELRYDINNGITLCHFHHPMKRKEEKRLSPYFMELVSVPKE